MEEGLEPAINVHVVANANAGFSHDTGSSGNGCASGVFDGDVELAVAVRVEVGMILDHIEAALACLL